MSTDSHTILPPPPIKPPPLPSMPKKEKTYPLVGYVAYYSLIVMVVIIIAQLHQHGHQDIAWCVAFGWLPIGLTMSYFLRRRAAR